MDRVDAAKPLAFTTSTAWWTSRSPRLQVQPDGENQSRPGLQRFRRDAGGATAVTQKNGSSDGRYRIRIDNASAALSTAAVSI